MEFLRVVQLFSVSASYIDRVLVEFELFSTGRAALGLPGGLVEVSPFASGLCGVACLLFRKRSSVQI